MEWLLFLPQLPATPSTLRVAVWRRMRAQGGLGLQNGVWVLPHTAAHTAFVQDLLGYLDRQGATGYAFSVQTPLPDLETRVLDAFRAQRDEEYAEFNERCQVLLDELARESQLGKFTFAELEEAEEDLSKLEHWLPKISARDFTGNDAPTTPRRAALDCMARCRAACQDFAAQVYTAQGIQPPEGDAAP